MTQRTSGPSAAWAADPGSTATGSTEGVGEPSVAGRASEAAAAGRPTMGSASRPASAPLRRMRCRKEESSAAEEEGVPHLWRGA